MQFIFVASLCILAWMLTGKVLSAEDPGREAIGRVQVTVYYATNGELEASKSKLTAVPFELEKRLIAEDRLHFSRYGVLGQDTQALLRSYESWASPLKPSSEVLVRFEAKSLPTPKVTPLDLELWIGRKKILKTDADLRGNQPLFVLGPKWRSGQLIIGVSLAR